MWPMLSRSLYTLGVHHSLSAEGAHAQRSSSQGVCNPCYGGVVTVAYFTGAINLTVDGSKAKGLSIHKRPWPLSHSCHGTSPQSVARAETHRIYNHQLRQMDSIWLSSVANESKRNLKMRAWESCFSSRHIYVYNVLIHIYTQTCSPNELWGHFFLSPPLAAFLNKSSWFPLTRLNFSRSCVVLYYNGMAQWK